MSDINILNPIRTKILQWITYKNNSPKCDYRGNELVYDTYRAHNDLDCQLTGGDLKADTIFSLSLPLRYVLMRIWNRKRIWNNSVYVPSKSYSGDEEYWKFMNDLYTHTSDYLPTDNPLIEQLSQLFEFGMRRENVMLLPDRKLQKRGKCPYYDYMPYFLHECFDEGDFHFAFITNENVIGWIKDQHLEMFFENEDIQKGKILDLHGTGDVTKNLPIVGGKPKVENLNIEGMLDNYITILQARKKYYR